MAIPEHIRDYLIANQVLFRHFSHEPRFDAQRVAATAHVRGRDYAKTVIVWADGRLLMAVVPADRHLDLLKLARLTDASSVRLATEPELETAFPGCDVGAMPPLGELYGVPVWLDVCFEDHRMISFNGGTYTDTVQISMDAFHQLVHPEVASLTKTEV